MKEEWMEEIDFTKERMGQSAGEPEPARDDFAGEPGNAGGDFAGEPEPLKGEPESARDDFAGEPTENSGAQENTGSGEIMELLDPRICRALEDMGFEMLTPIQEQAIPVLLEGRDIIGQAQTGTGKTAAFGIPLIQKVDPELQKLQAVVLCPTRELAIQAALELRKLAKYYQGLKILPVYGGQDISRQIKALPGVQIIVGTPGRVMDHMRRHTVRMADVSMAVLDEADEMLNMGFREDMELILGEIPEGHQTALFSATMPKPILEITGKFQRDAVMIKVTAEELTIPLVSQKYFLIKNQDKDAATVRLLEYYQPKLCLIFCNTKAKVEELAEVLKKEDFQAEGLHGDLIQHQRDVVMNRFRNGSTNILIATDVAARGIDVDDVEIVINYDIPQDIEYYVHRIGRTGRAGKTGQSFTFVNAREHFKIRQIERFCKTTVEEKKLPDPSKVLRSKAAKYLDGAWELRESEDLDLMKVYLRRKFEKEGIDLLDLAACMLKLQIGEKGEEIPEDRPMKRESCFGKNHSERGRGGRFGRQEQFGRNERNAKPGKKERSEQEERFGREKRTGRDNRENKAAGRGKEDRWSRVFKKRSGEEAPKKRENGSSQKEKRSRPWPGDTREKYEARDVKDVDFSGKPKKLGRKKRQSI